MWSAANISTGLLAAMESSDESGSTLCLVLVGWLAGLGRRLELTNKLDFVTGWCVIRAMCYANGLTWIL